MVDSHLNKPSRRLLSPGDVATRFGVNVGTVARWSQEGKLPAQVTPGGHRRYRIEDVELLLGERF